MVTKQKCKHSFKAYLQCLMHYKNNKESLHHILLNSFFNKAFGPRCYKGHNLVPANLYSNLQLYPYYTGSKEDMNRLEELFMDEKFHPLDSEIPPLPELLAIPLNRELKKKKKSETSMYCKNALYKLC